MAIFRGFKAVRPAKSKQALIPELPYDVMSSAEAREKAKGNPYSFLHVDKAEIDLPENIDLYDARVYQKAAENLASFVRTGAFIQDSTPCFYIYRQIMNGRSQTGIAGCAGIDDYINNVIKKHEHTLPKKEIDRIRHVEACNANTGPVFLTYRKNDQIKNIVSRWILEHSEEYDFIHDGVRQTVWVIDDGETVNALTSAFAQVESMYIADGHHRCASAVHVGENMRRSHPGYTGDEEFNYFLAVAFPDDELKIMDYNRVVKDLNGYTPQAFISEVSKNFEIKKSPMPVKPEKKHTFGMFLGGRWYLLKAKDMIINELDPIERLDVSILQHRLLDPVLAIKDPKTDDRIDFVGGIRGLEELEKRACEDMSLAFSMYPTTVDDLMKIADAGRIMPPKSTWFEPKLLSGLFIHRLTDQE